MENIIKMENVVIKEIIRDHDEASEVEIPEVKDEFLDEEDLNHAKWSKEASSWQISPEQLANLVYCDAKLDKQECNWQISQDPLMNHVKREYESAEESIDTNGVIGLETTGMERKKADLFKATTDSQFLKNSNTDCNRNRRKNTKNPDTVKTYKCEICDYASTVKCNYAKHILIHKDPRELNFLYCDKCSYNSLRKDNLRAHIRTKHLKLKPDQNVLVKAQNPPEKLKKFVCQVCHYRTNHTHDFKKHLRTHQRIENLEMFQCEICNFMTKRKDNLRTHLLTHRDPKELETFSCELCGFKTIHKRDLQRHSLIHKPPEELKMFGCDQCKYKSKRKDSVKRHKIRNHGLVDKITSKVNRCKSKQKSNFKKMLKHKKPQQLQMVKCCECSYESKYKACLSKHTLNIHNYPQFEVVKYES